MTNTTLPKLKVLILDDRLDYRNIFCLNMLVYTEADIKIFKDFDTLMDHLEDNSVDGVIINTTPELLKRDPDFHINNLLKLNPIRPQVFMIGLEKSPYETITCISHDEQPREIIRGLAQKAGITAQMMATSWKDEYYPLPIKYFIPGWQVVRPIYAIEGDRNVKLLTSGDIITQQFLEDFSDIEQIYLKSEFRLEVVNSFTESIVNTLADDKISARERAVSTGTAYKMIAESINTIGLPDKSVELANNAISSMEKLVQSEPNLMKLAEMLDKDNQSLNFCHSMLLCHTGIHILKMSPWANKQHVNQWTGLCFFHDMLLSKDEWVFVESETDLKHLKATEKEKAVIKNHAKLTAKLLSQYKNLPTGIDTLVKQHHGTKMGDSLGKVSMGITPMAVLFVLLEDWVKVYIQYKEQDMKEYDYAEFINTLYKKYPYPNFRKQIDQLRKVPFGNPY